MFNTTQESVWIVTDGKPGHENQSRAVAYHLGYSKKDIRLIESKWPSRLEEFCYRLRVSFMPTRILPAFAEQQIKGLTAPELVISTGTLCTALNVALAQRFYCRNVVIMKPSIIPYNRFSALLIPSHDITYNQPKNVIETPLPPAYVDNTIISSQLEELYSLSPELKQNSPTIAVLIGGTSKHAVFTNEYVTTIATQILKMMQLKPDLRLLLTSSRRTGYEAEQIFKNILEPVKSRTLAIWASETKFNPIVGFCQLAQAVIITSDSHSMISEAITCGHYPIVLELPTQGTHKHQRLMASISLHQLGMVVKVEDLSLELLAQIKPKQAINPAPKWLEELKMLIQK